MDPALMRLLESMWNYLAWSLSPNGYSPHNSDSDRPQSDRSQVIKPLVTVPALLEAAEVHRRPDWTYIATNGARGERPRGLPSICFPWAGQVIMRSGWDADVHWAFFDIGPWGILHQHNDALHLSVTAHGRDLLVDSGRYTYQNYWGEPGTWRSYFIGSAAHNVILVDGLGQGNGPRAADRPIGEDRVVVAQDYDFAVGSFTNGFTDAGTASIRHKSMVYGQDTYANVKGEITHTRAVLYLRGLCWVVVDRIETPRPCRITPLWHFHPDCTVVREGQSVVTVDKGIGNLRIQPIAPVRWDIEFVRGREGPDFQGWYSPEMDVRQPNTCVCYSATIPQTTTVAWLLLPGKGRVPEAGVKQFDSPEGAVHLMLDGFAPRSLEIAIRLNVAAAMQLSNGEEVKGPCAIRWHGAEHA